MISSKFCLFKDLEQLQINRCQTDICLVGAGGVKVFIHRAMLFADHVQPHPVWYQLDPGMTKREMKQRLDMINVSLSLLKLKRDEALTNNDRETAKKVMRSIDQTREEKQKLEDELEASNTPEEGSDGKDDVEDDNITNIFAG